MTINEAVKARAEVVHTLYGYVMGAFTRMKTGEGVTTDESKTLPSLLYLLLKEPLGSWVDEGEPHV